MKIFTFPREGMNSLILRLVLIAAFAGMAMMAQAQATVQTDLLDYPPGSTAIITGAGFQAGEYVELHVHHVGVDSLGTDPQNHQPWFVTADVDGNFTTSWYVPSVAEGDALGATLNLEAHGNMGSVAQWTFTDGNGDPFFSSTISPTVWTLVAPSTYSITISNLTTNLSNPTHIGNITAVRVVIPADRKSTV